MARTSLVFKPMPSGLSETRENPETNRDSTHGKNTMLTSGVNGQLTCQTSAEQVFCAAGAQLQPAKRVGRKLSLPAQNERRQA